MILCGLLLQFILISVMFLFIYYLCQVVINLMFDFDISLFILSMWINIICDFDFSHVKHEDYYYKLCEFTEYKVEIQKESDDTDMRRDMITPIDTVTQVSIKFSKKRRKTTKR